MIRHNLSNVFRIRILAKAGIRALASYYNFTSLFLLLTVLLDMLCEVISNMLQPLRLEQDLLFHSEELKYMSHYCSPVLLAITGALCLDCCFQPRHNVMLQ